MTNLNLQILDRQKNSIHVNQNLPLTTSVIFPSTVPAKVPAFPTQAKCAETDCMTLLSFKIASHLLFTARMIGNPILVTFPSLCHVTWGVGVPMNTHLNSTSDPTEAITFGCCTSTFKGIIEPLSTTTIIINNCFAWLLQWWWYLKCYSPAWEADQVEWIWTQARVIVGCFSGWIHFLLYHLQCLSPARSIKYINVNDDSCCCFFFWGGKRETSTRSLVSHYPGGVAVSYLFHATEKSSVLSPTGHSYRHLIPVFVAWSS